MKTICERNGSLSQFVKYLVAVLFLIVIDGAGFAQTVNNPTDTKHNNDNHVTTEFNYDTRETPWYLQPWIWAIVASILILFIAYATQGTLKRHMEDDSETGTAH